jgi:predicted DCC family thiol-disulfide oxidoreductase YuxK
MKIELFPFVCIAAWLVFLPGGFWNAVARRTGTPSRRGLVIYFDGTCAFCQRMTLLLRTFLLLPAARVRRCQVDESIEADMRQRNSWVVVDQTGRRDYAFDGFVQLLRQSPLFFPLAWPLGLRWCRAVGNRIYAWVAGHRPLMGRLTCCLRVRKPPRFARVTRVYISTVSSLLVAIWLVYIVLYNLQWFQTRLPVTVMGSQFDVMTWFKSAHYREFRGQRVRYDYYDLGRQLRLDQKWGMFTRVPLRRDGWLVMPGTMANGQQIDIWSGRRVTWDKPDDVSSTFPNYRWYKYMEKFHGSKRTEYQKYYPSLCQYFCREWNRTHTGDQRLTSLEIWFVVEMTRPPHVKMTHDRVKVLQCECP